MPTITGSYAVRGGEPVFVTVLIGDGQEGVSTIFLDQEKISSRVAVSRLPLGDGADLAGRTLVVSSTVVDIRNEHDHTSVTVVLANGRERRFPQSEDAQPSGVVNYLTVINLVPETGT